MEDPNKKTCTVDETEGHFSGWICTLMLANVTLFKCYSLSNTRLGCACVFAFMWGSRRPCLFLLYYYFFIFLGKAFPLWSYSWFSRQLQHTGNHSYIQASFCFISFYLFFRFLHNFSIVECPFIFDFLFLSFLLFLPFHFFSSFVSFFILFISSPTLLTQS